MDTASKTEIAIQKLRRLRLPERVLLALSKHPRDVDPTVHFKKPESVYNGANALQLLRKSFAGFDELISGKDVLDFGCGDGFQAVAMVEAGARSVLGVDIAAQRVENARAFAAGNPHVRFEQHIGDAKVDVIVSQDAFEHLDDPRASLEELRRALRPGGRILLSFGPPWYSPYGAHMYHFSDLPWMNILFSERTVMRVRSVYQDDGRVSYAPGLNRMTIRRFESVVQASGLEIERSAYSCPKWTKWLRVMPGVRELFISHVDAVLRERAS